MQNWRHTSDWTLKFVGVCGKIYPVYEYQRYNLHGNNEYFHAYTVEDVIKIIKAQEPEKLKSFMVIVVLIILILIEPN